MTDCNLKAPLTGSTYRHTEDCKILFCAALQGPFSNAGSPVPIHHRLSEELMRKLTCPHHRVIHVITF